MFLLIFRYVFGGAIAVRGVNYVDFVVPGFITTGVLFNPCTPLRDGRGHECRPHRTPAFAADPAQRRAHRSRRADTGMQVWGLVDHGRIGFLVGFRIHSDWVRRLRLLR